MTEDLDRRLARYLEDAETDRREGNTLGELRRAVATCVDGLHAHEVECHRYRVEQQARHDSAHARLVALEASSALPPMRAEFDSSHNLGEFAHKVEQAAIEGYRRQDSTPEELVAKVVAEAEAKRERDVEFKRLQKAEANRIAEDARVAVERAQERKDRHTFTRNMILAVVGGGAGITSLVEAVRALVHHGP